MQTKRRWIRSAVFLNLDLASLRAVTSAAWIASAISSSSWQSDEYELVSLLKLTHRHTYRQTQRDTETDRQRDTQIDTQTQRKQRNRKNSGDVLGIFWQKSHVNLPIIVLYLTNNKLIMLWRLVQHQRYASLMTEAGQRHTCMLYQIHQLNHNVTVTLVLVGWY